MIFGLICIFLECPSPVVTYIILVIALLVLVVFFVFLVVQGRKEKNKDATSLRILLNHIQMLALLSGTIYFFKPFLFLNYTNAFYILKAIGTSWTDPFQTMLVIFGFLSVFDSRIVEIDCAAPIDYYLKYAFYLFFPLISALILAIAHSIIFLIIKIKRQFGMYLGRGSTPVLAPIVSNFFLSYVIITFITYPAICLKVMEIFNCPVVVEGQSYLQDDP